ncbi:group III truncated hemoglobin [Negadavirga shengliensis]|uniref:Group III truncated hemoglobin n=1 Tax=Negadavirga shengliensis TaxID=1389218 RepID=A0ABV9SYJ5_9BACT
MKEKIEDIKHIKKFVDSFYAKVRRDPLLSPIFEERLGNGWEKHLEKMYRFWQTVLLEEHTYFGSPFAPHATMSLDKDHFERWLQLFDETLKESFQGEKAEEAKWRAEKMAQMFQIKLEYYRQHHIRPLT